MMLKCVVSILNTTKKGVTIYIRAITIERDGEQYGTYYQAVRSYREKGQGEARGGSPGRAQHR
jgi:hypothetical protein